MKIANAVKLPISALNWSVRVYNVTGRAQINAIHEYCFTLPLTEVVLKAHTTFPSS